MDFTSQRHMRIELYHMQLGHAKPIHLGGPASAIPRTSGAYVNQIVKY